jgi:hypothetical protein
MNTIAATVATTRPVLARMCGETHGANSAVSLTTPRQSAVGGVLQGGGSNDRAATLPYVLDSAASFDFAGFNGRAITDNVMNVMLSLQTNTPVDDGASVARTNILDEFPYFGAPHADPIVD